MSCTISIVSCFILALMFNDLTAQNADSEYLTPIYQSDTSAVYDVDGLRIQAEPGSKVLFVTGPDFHVFHFMLLGNDSVSLYRGRHPDLPHFSSLAYKRGWQDVKQKYLDKARLKNGYYLHKEENPTLIFDANDSIIGTVTDTLIWELIVMQDKNLWITRPMENRNGQVDILIELLPVNERPYYHLFGQSYRKEYPEILIDLAKTMK